MRFVVVMPQSWRKWLLGGNNDDDDDDDCVETRHTTPIKENDKEEEEEEIPLLVVPPDAIGKNSVGKKTTLRRRSVVAALAMSTMAALSVFGAVERREEETVGLESRRASAEARRGARMVFRGRDDGFDDDAAAKTLLAPNRAPPPLGDSTTTTKSNSTTNNTDINATEKEEEEEEEEEESVFIAVRDVFKYESRILDVDNSTTSSSKRNYELDDGAFFGASRQWGSIRAKLKITTNETARENGRKLFLFVRHGEATHNVWGERQRGEAQMPNDQVPCTDEVTGKSLLDPSLTQLGLHEATESGKALGTYLEKAFKESEEDEQRVSFFTSPQARTIESSRVAVLHTSSVNKYQNASGKPIRVSDMIRNKVDLSVPFEIRRPYSFENELTGDPIQYGGLSRALAKREEKYLDGCEFTTTLRDITSIHENDAFEIATEDITRENKCRLGEATNDSVFTCANELGLLVNSDGELRYESNELTMHSVRNRMRVWFANVFEEERDAKVIVAFVHGDVIEGALRELYGDDMKSEYKASNGDVVPMLVKDCRPKEYLNFWNETDY
jgi:hypothetical protein